MASTAVYSMARARSHSHSLAAEEGFSCDSLRSLGCGGSPRSTRNEGDEGVKGNTGGVATSLLGNSFLSYVLAGLAGSESEGYGEDSEPVSWVWKSAASAEGGEGEEGRYEEREKHPAGQEEAFFSWFTASSSSTPPSPSPSPSASPSPSSGATPPLHSSPCSSSSPPSSPSQGRELASAYSDRTPERRYAGGSSYTIGASPLGDLSRTSSSSPPSSSASESASSSPKYDGSSAKACEDTSLLASLMAQLVRLDAGFLSAAGTPKKLMGQEESWDAQGEAEEKPGSSMTIYGSKSKWE